MNLKERLNQLKTRKKELEKKLRRTPLRSELLPGSREIIQEGINEIRQVKGYEGYADSLQKLLNENRIFGKKYYGNKPRLGESDLITKKMYLNQDQFNNNPMIDAQHLKSRAFEVMPTLVHEANHMLDDMGIWEPGGLWRKITPTENLAYATEINFLVNLRKQNPWLSRQIDDKLEDLKQLAGKNFQTPLTFRQNPRR